MTPEEVLKATLEQAKAEKMVGLSEESAREMAKKAIRAAEQQPRRRTLGALPVAAAALLCIAGGFGVMAWTQSAPGALVEKDVSPEELGQEPEALAHAETPRESQSADRAEAAEPVEASADVRLPTGDRLLSATGTHYDVVSTAPDRVVALTEGDVLFDIESIAGGSFVVDAGDTQVRVLGTVFSVKRTAAGVAVLVYEGRVAVTDASGQRVLGAGEFWASNGSLVDAAWREASEARWNAIQSESATRLAAPESTAPSEPESAPEPEQVEAEPEEARALLLRREYRDVLEIAQAELDENQNSAQWMTIAADAYRGLQDWESAARAYRSSISLVAGTRRGQMGYAAAQIYADRLHRPHLALAALEEGRATSAQSMVEERARSLQIRLLEDTNQRAELEDAVDAYLARFPDTYTARRLRNRSDEP